LANRELVWSALKRSIIKNETWIVGGDYNTLETFDAEGQDKRGKGLEFVHLVKRSP